MKTFKKILLSLAVWGFSVSLPMGAMVNSDVEKIVGGNLIESNPTSSSLDVEAQVNTAPTFLGKTTQFATSSQKAFSDFLGKAREKASQCFNSGVAKVRNARERFKRKRLGDDIESQSSFISDLDSQGQKRKKETDLPMVQPIGNDMVQITGLNGSESYQTDLRSINIHFDQATESFDIYTWNKNYTLNIRATFPLNLAVEHVASDVLKNSNPYSFDPERGIDLRVEQNSVIFLDHQTQNVLARFSRQNLNQSQYDIINIIYTTAMNNLSNVALVASPLIYSALSYVHPVAPLVVVAYDIYKIIDNAGRYIVKVVKNNTH